MRADTRIWTENGLKNICDILPGERVLSYDQNCNQFVLSPTSGAFPKGKDYLFRVQSQHGEFVSSGHHHSLSSHGTYQQISELGYSSGLYRLNRDLPKTTSGSDLKLLFSDEGHYSQKDVDSLVNYGELSRQYGQQFLQGGEDAGACHSLSNDVLKSHPVSLKNSDLSITDIIKVSVKEVKEVYWDIQVLNTNNYVDEYGHIHHNSGKTQTLLARAIRDKFMWPRSTVALYEPTYDLARLILIPRLLELLDTANVPYLHNKSENVIYLLNRGMFVIRTLDKPNRIIGYEAFRSHVDEIDTLKFKNAQNAWNKIIARNRQKLPGSPTNQVCAYTTPEGFNFVYNRWEKNPSKEHIYVRASTYSNQANLPEDYVDSLKGNYDENLLEAYVEGIFTNLTSGTVYHMFSRKHNHSDVRIDPRQKEPLHIGMDFNVGRGCAVVHVLRDGSPIAVDEVVNSFDTPDTIRVLNSRYHGWPITVYPDATSKNRKSQNATESDLQLLKDERWRIKRRSRNPVPKDRIASMNGMFCNSQGERRYKVNTSECPFYTDSLEQQAYDANGLPEKGEGKGDDICFGGDQLVETDKGIFRFKDIPRTGKVRVSNEDWSSYVKGGIKKKQQKVYKYVFSLPDARSYYIIATPDHLFLTEDLQWVEIGKANKGQKFITEIPMLNTGDIGSVSLAVKALGYYIGKSIKTRWSQFQRGMSSIIKTMIRTITKLRIWNLCLVPIMQNTIWKNGYGTGFRGAVSLLTGTAKRRHGLGINQRKDENRLVKITKKSNINSTNEAGLLAPTVKRSMKRKFKSAISIVQRRVQRRPEESREWMLSSILVNIVERYLKGTDTFPLQNTAVELVTMNPEEDQDVYCLTVPDYGYFKLTKHSPIVSNCDAGGYYIHGQFPIKKRVLEQTRLSGL